MRQGLRKVSELPSLGSDFLRKQAEMIGVAKNFFKVEPCLFHIAGQRQRFDMPKRTHGETAFATGQSILRSFEDVVTRDERIFTQILPDHLQGRSPARIRRANE